MCHDYLPEGRDNYVWETTVADERAHNVHAHDGVTEDEFVAMREARDIALSMPRLIMPSIQVNMRAGHMPRSEEHTSELQSLMRLSYAVFCLQQKNKKQNKNI